MPAMNSTTPTTTNNIPARPAKLLIPLEFSISKKYQNFTNDSNAESKTDPSMPAAVYCRQNENWPWGRAHGRVLG